MYVVCPRCGVDLGTVEPLDLEVTVQRPCPACAPHVAPRAPRVIYVDPRQPELLRELADIYRGDPTIQVLPDRRGDDRRRRPDRRMGRRDKPSDRRGGSDRRTRQVGIVVRGRPAS